jgi:AhpD family alkylhydroperoxidase
MKARIDFAKAAPTAYKAMAGLEMFVRASGLDPILIHLVKLRSSQINGCAYCIDMHIKEALHDGEHQQRLNLVGAWRESPLFTEKERAALEWTETLTRIADHHVSDELFERVSAHFGPEELVKLTVLINTINGWNRLAVSFRAVHPVDAPLPAAA